MSLLPIQQQQQRPLPPQQKGKRHRMGFRMGRCEPVAMLCLTLLLVVLSAPSSATVSAFETNLPGTLFAKQQTEAGTTNGTQQVLAEERPLGEPNCILVEEELVCEVVYLWTLGSQQPDTMVAAAITCPIEQGLDPVLASINNPQECGCGAQVSKISENSTSTNLQECSCEWCAGADGNITGLSVTCPSSVHEGCSSIGCDGGCRDDTDSEGTNNSTTTPIATQDPTSGATTVAPVNDTTVLPTSSPGSSTEAPEATPMDGRTLYWIPSAFNVFNSEQKQALDLSTSDQKGLNDAYVSFVKSLMAEMDSPAEIEKPTTNNNGNTVANTTRHLLRQSKRQAQSQFSRRLTPDFTQAAEVYMIQDDPTCPANVPAESTCQIAYGRYQVLLSNEDDPTSILEQYAADTQKAISEGLLQNELAATDPDNILTVHSPSAIGMDGLTPATATGTCSFCANGEQPMLTAQEFPIGGSESAILQCASMVELYAKQPPEQCLNFESTVTQELEPRVNLFFQALPVQFQDICQCPPSSANSISLQDKTDTATCGPFCPFNRKVPEQNFDFPSKLQKGLTCQNLAMFADSIIDMRMCDKVERDGAACCTETINIELEIDAVEQTSPPTLPGTGIVTIESTFLTYNIRGLNAALLMEGPELESVSNAYSVFVEDVVFDVQSDAPPATVAPGGNATTPSTVAPSSNEARFLRSRLLQQPVEQSHQRQRRRLEVTLDMSSAEVYAFNDTKCPSTVPRNASCAIGFGHYDLFLIDENNETVSEEYTNATQGAIGAGQFDETLQEEERYTVVNIKSTADGYEILEFEIRTGSTYYDEGGYDEFFMIGIGVSIAAIVVTVVAILCASDLSGPPEDDDIDPWEKDHSRGSRSRAKEKAPDKKKNKFSPHNKDIPPKTERQEYEVFRAQIEILVQQKTPEEFDNIDDLMDLFYERELLLIATLDKMPDCSEHIYNEAEAENEHATASNFNDSHLDDSNDWLSFADEDSKEEEDMSGDGSEGGGEKKKSTEEEEEDDDDDDDADEFSDEDDEEDENDEQVLGADPSLSRSAHTIEEGDEDDISESLVSESESAKVAMVDGAETEDDEEEDEEEEDTLPPPPAAATATAPSESMDDSSKSADENWEDEK